MNQLPPNVRALMTGRVNTVEKLVVITELGKRTDRRMRTDELLRVLPFDEAELREALRELESGKIIAVGKDTVELASNDPDLDDLLRTYEDDPIGTVTALSKIALTRIRSMASAFADAFHLRKKR